MLFRSPVGLPRVFFLDARRIRQDEAAEVRRAGGAEHRTAKSPGDQSRQIPHMIEMCVCEDHRIDLGRWDRKGIPVAKSELLEPLEQPTIHEDSLAPVLDDEFRTGDGACRTREGQSSHDRRYIMRG